MKRSLKGNWQIFYIAKSRVCYDLSGNAIGGFKLISVWNLILKKMERRFSCLKKL